MSHYLVELVPVALLLLVLPPHHYPCDSILATKELNTSLLFNIICTVAIQYELAPGSGAAPRWFSRR